MKENANSGCVLLRDEIVKDLVDGRLTPILEIARKDDTILFEVRSPNTVTLYYRGARLFKLEHLKGQQYYRLTFNWQYFEALIRSNDDVMETRLGAGKSKAGVDTKQRLAEMGIDVSLDKKDKNEAVSIISNRSDSEKWYSLIPLLKTAVDRYKTERQSTGREREFQQTVVQENNFTFAKESDYFILDTEYTISRKVVEKERALSSRLDLVGAYWPETARDQNKPARLAIFEMKYGEGALAGIAGISDHVKKLKRILGGKEDLKALKEKLEKLARLKWKLRLMRRIKHWEDFTFSDEPLQYILILANHVPVGNTLSLELSIVSELQSDWVRNVEGVDVRVAVSTFAGYALFEQNILTLQEFLDLYERQIGECLK